MAEDAATTLGEVHRRLSALLGDLVGPGLSAEWAQTATALYKEQYAKKQNPYGEAWAYRKGDERRKVSGWKFGKVLSVDADGFSLIVAGPNAKRSCVPFEPRGLGAWRVPFNDVLTRRMATLVRGLRG
jgi:hypothetical protein